MRLGAVAEVVCDRHATEVAVLVDLPVVVQIHDLFRSHSSSMLSAAAAEIGIPAIIAEAGGCGLVEPAAVNAHVRGLDRVLALLGMADDPAAGEGRGERPPISGVSSGCAPNMRAGGNQLSARVSRWPKGSCSGPSAASTAHRFCRHCPHPRLASRCS